MRLAVLVLFASLAAACGGSTAPSAAESAAEATSVGPDVTAVDVCAGEVPDDFEFDADPDAMLSEAGRLEPMLGQVLAYGGERPDEFAGYRLEWIGPNDASVVITMTGEIERHRSALVDIVEFPDELVVCEGPTSGESAQALLDELQPELNGRAASWGKDTAGHVEIGLFADDEAFAAELIERYGERVEVRVGAFEYPLPDPLPASTCPSLESTTERADLDIVAVAPTLPLQRSGGDVRSIALVVELTNTGDGRVEFGSGAALGYLVNNAGDVVAGPGQLGIPSVGLSIDVGPGESSTFPVVLSTASCDPRAGYVVPAGDYQLIAVVSQGVDASLRSSPIDVLVE